MSLPQNVVTRPGSSRLYYRESVPTDVRELLHARGERSKAEVWKSLGTSDRATARRLVTEVRAAQYREWDAIRGKPHSPHSRHTPDEFEILAVVADVAFDQYSHRLKKQRADLRDAGPEALAAFVEAQIARGRKVASELALGKLGQWETIVDRLIEKQGWLLPKNDPQGTLTPQYLDVCHKLAEAWIDAHEINLRQLQGDAFAEARSPTVKRAKASNGVLAAPGETLTELFERYANQKLDQNEKRRDTLDQERKVVEQFAAFVGKRRCARSITKADVREFRDVLKAVPVKHTSRKGYEGLALREAAAKGRMDGLPTRTSRTIYRELSAISAFFTWMVREDFADDNPTPGLFPTFDKKKGKYPSFTDDQLNAIFSSPLFTSCSGEPGKEHVPGNVQVRDWRFWLPLCAMFTGARIGELAQLLASDVREIDGIWVFDLVDEEDDEQRRKSLKTAASRRIVPVHEQLIAFGFLDYAAKVRSMRVHRLFPELKPNARGHHAADASRFWRNYLKRIGLKQADDGLGSHSFRHTIADKLRLSGYRDAEFGPMILGHSNISITGGYGTLSEGTLKMRNDMIQSVSFERVTLKHLWAP